MIDIYEQTEMAYVPVEVSKSSARFRMITKIAEIAGLVKTADKNGGGGINILLALQQK
jgi:hypothetical protein